MKQNQYMIIIYSIVFLNVILQNNKFILEYAVQNVTILHDISSIIFLKCLPCPKVFSSKFKLI